jgi:hypothetical protein
VDDDERRAVRAFYRFQIRTQLAMIAMVAVVAVLMLLCAGAIWTVAEFLNGRAPW